MAAITAHIEPPVSAPSQSYFESVNSNLLRLGALTLEDFLRDPYQEPAAQENFLSNPLYHDAPVAPPPVVEDKDGENKPAPIPAPIFVLHQICSQTFGSIDALHYEIIEEEGKESESRPLSHFPISHTLTRKTVHPHHHAPQRRHALVHVKTRVCTQGSGARRGSFRGGRHGRDRFYQVRLS